MSDIERVVEWLTSLGGRTSNEYARAIQALSARAEAAEAEVERLKGVLGAMTAERDSLRQELDGVLKMIGDAP